MLLLHSVIMTPQQIISVNTSEKLKRVIQNCPHRSAEIFEELKRQGQLRTFLRIHTLTELRAILQGFPQYSAEIRQELQRLGLSPEAPTTRTPTTLSDIVRTPSILTSTTTRLTQTTRPLDPNEWLMRQSARTTPIITPLATPIERSTVPTSRRSSHSRPSSVVSTVLSEWFTPPVFNPIRLSQSTIDSINALAPGGLINGIDPKRRSLGFTEQERGVAIAITQMSPENSMNGYLTALCLVFSPERANALLTKISR